MEPTIIESESPKIKAVVQPVSTMILPKDERLIIKDGGQGEEAAVEEAGEEDDQVRGQRNGIGENAKKKESGSLRSEYLKPSADVDDLKSDKMEGAAVLDEDSAKIEENFEELKVKERYPAPNEL